MHFHLVAAVFEAVRNAHRLVRQLALLADRHEAGRQLVRQRAAEDEAARLDAGDLVNAGPGIGADQFIDGLPESGGIRSEEHTSELQSLMRSSYAVFCLKKKNK